MSVTLVGAGCGSPRLLTIAARESVSRADHIVYDRLIHPDILQLAPDNCVFHPVGKKESNHTLPQNEINTLLIRLAASKANVVRLKGGDPFVFGRGAEEAMALESAGIEWNAISGVTSALGGAIGSGLPVTQRGTSSSLTFATVQRYSSVDLKQLSHEIADSEGTVALYMGTSAFAALSEELIAAGKPPDTPVAVIAWGGWGRARRINGSLLEIREVSQDEGLPSPSVIYIGGSAGSGLSPKRGALAGMQVAICRPYPECWNVGRMIEEHDADCYGLPLLEIAPMEPGDAEETRTAVERADWLVLTSPRGALELRRVVRDIRRIRGKVAAIGEGTAKSLRGIGIEPEHTAGGTSESLAELLSSLVKQGESVVFARNERGSHVAVEAASAAGASVRSIPTYMMKPRELRGFDVMCEQWESCGLDAVVFGSAALVEEYARVIGSPPDTAETIAWGSACADAILKIFGRKALKMSTPDIHGLIEVLKKIYNSARINL
jgi:uroporphyrinogen III methyltransferase/synthase